MFKRTPFGRYDYLLRIELLAQEEVVSCGIEKLRLQTVFQHDLFALPMLHPGRNRITVRGEIKGRNSLVVRYEWEDSEKEVKAQSVEVTQLPFQYEILTKGSKWEDVVCRSLTISVVPKTQEKAEEKAAALNITEAEPQPGQEGHVFSFSEERLIGRYRAGPLGTVETYAGELDRLLRRLKSEHMGHSTTKKVSRKIGRTILALSALGAPGAKAILERVIMEDTSHPFQNKSWACQGLYRCVGNEAASTMMAVLERDPRISWGDPEGKWSEDAMWLHTAHMAAAVLAKIGSFEGKERAADLIGEILKGKRTARLPSKMWRGKEICWGFIRALGKLGGPRHIPLLRKYLRERNDATALAVVALTEIGDPAIVPQFVPLLKDFRYSPIGLYAIRSIGKLGGPGDGEVLVPFLAYWDEDFRGAAAKALGELGYRGAIPMLKRAAKREPFEWVRDEMVGSLRTLSKP
ncbi:MAG: HEAT repeat domain-containing protein [Deltaproteobacteria bacterium]|nr:HEAT repeat domain-containing protein [Deltaproteobacteria bacterium]